MAIDGEWRRFGFTVRVVLASALAQEESVAVRRGIGGNRFAFLLMAAATGEQPALPAGGWFDSARSVRATCTPEGGEIRLQLQAEGFSTVRRVARRSARLVAANGAFDIVIRFDGDGRALAVLADGNAVRQGLCAFELVLEHG